ncbi:glycosyltransferase family 2 protein [Vibrio mimicus]|uniref:glycosyltransferase family 2 protein n=1 Tax=Vibrio mimicus TaxID=674 RepID=UPI002FF2A8D6
MLGSMSNYSIPKVSVIMPVYNTELYVERAMISLMEQTLDDVQFIIIDDGSKDNSLSIIKEVITRYPTRKDQITLLSRENRGVATTRAEGMELATGEYVIHLDSDDWVESQWLEKMYLKAIDDNADIVICNYAIVYPKKVDNINQFEVLDIIDGVKLLLNGKVSNMNWDKLVRRSIYQVHDIFFHSGLNMGEDFLVTLKTLFHSKRISFISDCLYYYNKCNEGALTWSYSYESLCNLINISVMAERFLRNNDVYNKYFYDFVNFKINVRSCFVLHSKFDISKIKEGFSIFMETDEYVLSSNVTPVFKVCYFLNKIKLSLFIPAFLKAFNIYLFFKGVRRA